MDRGLIPADLRQGSIATARCSSDCIDRACQAARDKSCGAGTRSPEVFGHRRATSDSLRSFSAPASSPRLLFVYPGA